MMYSHDKMMVNTKPLGPTISGTNCFSGRYSPTYRVPDQMRDPMRRCMTNPPSDIFGSLNDQGLLSRASEALVAMDMKHPVSSAHQVFPPIKSDMMYSHPAISSAAAAASGTSISRSSNHMDHPSMSGLDMLNSPHNGDSISSGSMTSLPMSADTHPSQLSHPGMYSHTTSSMMSPHSSIGHPHHPHHPQAPHITLPDADTDPRLLEMFAEHFKQRRIKLEATQCDVGRALADLKLPGVGILSQSTICRFESLTLSHNNMIALKPVLSAWLEEAEAAKRDPDGSGGVLPPGEKKRKRTSIAAPEKRSLEAYFAVQPRPSGEKIAAIAEKLDLKKNVVRVWFCNQRQKQKRMKFAAQTGL